MEKEEDVDEEKKKKSGIKVSDNLLYHIFGLRNSNLYNNIKKGISKGFQDGNSNRYSNLIALNTNSLIFKETREFFLKKEHGLKNFVDKFLENRQNIYSILSKKNCSVDLEKIYDICQLNPTYNKRKTKSITFSTASTGMPESATSRFILYKNEEIFRLKTERAQKIQKYVKGFLARMKFYRLFNEILRERTLKNVILIQSLIRKFLAIKKLKLKLLFENIIYTRRKNAKRINSFIRKFSFLLCLRKRIIKKMILDERREMLVQIQSNLRMYLTKKQVKEILEFERRNYVLTYPFKCKKARLIVYINAPNNINYIMENVYDFKYNRILDMHVLYINPLDFKCGKYRVKMIVDGQVTCDGRFPHVEFSDGYYYNIINFYLNRHPEKRNSSSMKYSELIATNPETNEESRPGNFFLESGNESLHSNHNSSSYSELSYLKELRKNQPFTEVDMELKRNLENKEAKSYVEILKASVDKEFENDYNVDNLDPNFD
jgi:hypothetical protein